MKKTSIFIVLLGMILRLSGQGVTDFRPPMDIPLVLSGNFGELRSNHFHSGIDIKTQGVTGQKVFAIESGYVSRIKVRPGGYGKALYIAHPNGYTSVYGHLSGYSKQIHEYVTSEQYRRNSHSVDLYPEKGTLRVGKGELVAFSGNTGSSSGPHLHFEIRSSANQHPLNSLFFDFPIADRVAPKITKLVIYPVGEDSQVDFNTSPLPLNPVRVSDTYHLPGSEMPRVHGNIGFGIEVYDYLDDAPNRCGIYSIELKVDDKQYFYSEMDEFSFAESRFINAHIDYERKINHSESVQRLYKLPYNELSIYKYMDNDGLVPITDTLEHKVQITVNDSYGNTSEITFYVKGAGSARYMSETKKQPAALLPFNAASSFSQNGISLKFPAYCFYEDVPFTFARTGGSSDLISDIYYLHKETTPVHRSFSVEIEVPELNPAMAKKICLVKTGDKGEISYAGGNFSNGKIRAELREFGKYAVAIDSIPPEILPLDIFPGKQLTSQPGIRFRVEDDLSGISSYNGFINGQWVLFQYDPKNNLLHYEFDKMVPKSGKNHELEIQLTDDRGNQTMLHTNFYR